MKTLYRNLTLAILTFTGICNSLNASDWWDKQYGARQPITIDISKDGAALDANVESVTALIRLHEGNFQFLSAQENGSDIRFVADDQKTLLPFHIEKYDSLLNEGFIWVKIPEVKSGEKLQFWMYYGSSTPGEGGHDPAATYEKDTLLVYHFGERGVPASDSTGNGNTSQNSALTVEGSLIGSGIRLDGKSSIVIPSSEKFLWNSGADLSISVWIRPAGIEGRHTLIFNREGNDSFELGLENGIPFVEINDGGNIAKTSADEAMADAVWHHLAVVVSAGDITLYADGKNVSSLSARMPAMSTKILVGGEAEENDILAGFSGELDELQIASSAWSTAKIQFIAANQGTFPEASRLLMVGELSASGGGHGGSEALEHVMLFGDIAKNMMFDGWIAVGVCVLMILFGWTVAVQKFSYLNSIQKGSEAFIKLWHKVSKDLTALDQKDEKGERNFGGHLDPKTKRDLKRSPLYHLYHIGSEEINHRIGENPEKGLSARSIQAIRASLETGLVRENQRMNKGLIFLTISIAGGPYVGLLGTVVGVMITFALIAKTGEVEVNSIAPGIASALLATVAGLIVAIPALFIYSYLSSRIKDLLASMQVFIDEFIAKMAEFYPTPTESTDEGKGSPH